MRNDIASVSSKTLPPRSPKCFANVFLSIFIALMPCFEDTRGKLCAAKGIQSQRRDRIRTAEVKTGSFVARSCPSSLPPKREVLQTSSSNSLYSQCRVFICLQFVQFSKTFLNAYYLLWRVIMVKDFSIGKKFSHHSSGFLCICNTMDNGRHGSSMSYIFKKEFLFLKEERKIFRNLKGNTSLILASLKYACFDFSK